MTGKLIIAGGNLRKNKINIQRLLIEYAGGTDSKLAIVPTASGEGHKSAVKNIEDLWVKLGIKPNNIIKLQIFAEQGEKGRKFAQGDDEDLLEVLDDVSGLWFTGGNQYYTSKAFIRKDGTDTKMLEKMKTIYDNGGVVGGSSAGAAIMSSVMIASGNNKNALSPAKYGYEDYEDSPTNRNSYLRLVRGLGFFKEGVVDQHVDARPRILRLIRAVIDSNNKPHMGYGVSEDTAMIYNRDTNGITVVGSGAIYIVDCSKIQLTKRDGSFTFQNAILNVIKEGDSYNITEKNVEFMS